MNWPASFSYDLAFMPKMVWLADGSGRQCAVLGLCFVAASVLYLLICLWLSRWSTPPRLRVWSLLLSLYLLVTVIVAFNIADFSEAIPFPPIYLLLGMATMLLALLIAFGGYWLRLEPEVRATVSLSGFVKANTWLTLQSYAFFLIPVLLFRMPMFDHQQQRIYLVLPVLMLLGCVALLRLLLLHLFRLLALEQPCAELPAASREKFLTASEPLLAAAPDCRMLVAKSGLLNAMALPLTRTIVIGSDLLRILDPAEVRAVLTHELGHLKDRTHLPRLVRNSFLCVFLLWCTYFSSSARLPGQPFTSLMLLLVALYLGSWGNKSLRLKAEAFADRYVHETDAALFPALISGLEKLHRLNGIDKDFCKKYNYAHLDIDERIAAVEQGTLTARPNRWRRSALGFSVWMVLCVGLTLAFQYFRPSAKADWKELHDRHHALLKAGDDPAALQAIQQALDLAETRLGHNSGWTCTSLNDLTDYYQAHDDLGAAENYAKQALEVATATFGAEHERMIRCLTAMGEIRYARNDLDSAARFFTQALAIQTREKKDPNDRETTLHWLFRIQQKLGNLAELAKLHEQEIAMYAGLGKDGQKDYHYAVLDYVASLAQNKFFAAAEQQLAAELTKAETVFGRQSAEYADALLAKAKLSQQQGLYSEATTSCRDCLVILAGINGVESEEYAAALAVQADIYRQSGQLADAVVTYSEILRINRALYGSDSTDLIGDYWQLGLVYETMGRWDEAVSSFRKVVELEESMGDAPLESRIESHEKLLVAERALGNKPQVQRVEVKLQELRGGLSGETRKL